MNQTLTQANFMTSIRYFLTGGITYAAGKGYITTDTAANLGILSLAILPLAWGWYQNYLNKVDNEVQTTAAVRAGVAMAADPMVNTPAPTTITPTDAKTIVAAYAPTTKESLA